MADQTTIEWIRDESDRLAIENGCVFDEARAEYVVGWIEENCYLHEGVPPGTKMKLMPWAREVVMRLFGWIRPASGLWANRKITGIDTPYHTGWVRRFREASIWVPKKNGKSPLLAAVGCYLLFGDGEHGQKVFSCARDGKQAMICHDHAIKMVQASNLGGVNKSTKTIYDIDTKSSWAVVAGDNLNSQEGLNGSALVDETHVVNQSLMDIMKYMGRSRAEPIRMEVSTAGNNPDGYGKERFDLGLAVSNGREKRDDFLFVYYGAPQNLTDAELDADPLKYIREANPACGIVLDENLLLKEYHEAKKKLSALAIFKMYTLNIWQHTTYPWLRISDWAMCRENFKEQDLKGRTCFGGMDLGRRKDLCAVGYVFPDLLDSELVRVLVRLWVTEAYAESIASLVPFKDWARAGHVYITKGDVSDLDEVKAQIRRDATMFNIRQMAFDPLYAQEMTRNLAEGERDGADGSLIYKPIGFERIEFPQTVVALAGPTSQFERLVLAKKLRHNGNLALDWMAGHTQVKPDVNNNIRPIKPNDKKDSHKKIDGIVALIMGLGAYMAAPKMHGSKYEREGLATV